MKKSILVTLALCGMFATATPASAYTIEGASVGGLDTLYASESNPDMLLNSGETTEADWVSTVLGATYNASDIFKYEYDKTGPEDTVEFDDFWTPVDDFPTIKAYQFADGHYPSYFYIKIGKGDNVFDHYLYTNVADTNWAVIDTAAMSTGISHLGTVGGEVPVPEPGTMMLLGVGMFGLAIFGKRRMNK